MGPAHPVAGRVLGCTPFVFYCEFYFSNLFILFIRIACVPALKLSLGVYALGTRDVTSDLVRFPWGSPPRTSRTLSYA